MGIDEEYRTTKRPNPGESLTEDAVRSPLDILYTTIAPQKDRPRETDKPTLQMLESGTGFYLTGRNPVGAWQPTGDTEIMGIDKEYRTTNRPNPGKTLTEFAERKLCEQACDTDCASLTDHQRKEIRFFCFKYLSAFNAGDKPLSLTKLTVFNLELQHEHQRSISCSPHPLSPEKRAMLAKLVKDRIKEGTIQSSQSEWASAVVLVQKRSGKSRLCVDYRPLNAVTKTPNYPLPRIQQALDGLRGKRYFSVFDLPKAYWKIGVDPAEKEYLALITPDRLYKWTRMPFGVAGAPAIQQRMMDRLLIGMKWVSAIAHLDDIIIFSDTFEDHLRHLEDLFFRCEAANLQLQPLKSRLSSWISAHYTQDSTRRHPHATADACT